nr:hypothetical protein [Tanacetum cinerariifolium]
MLVTKPHNKTLYELLHDRTPSIGFMRPLGCPVTILNTLDPLGKFKGKVDEEFLVGYSINSKAFRVFNSRTRIVQETLYVNFLENKPNIAGNQSNPSADFQDEFDAKKVREEVNQQYLFFHMWSSGSTNPQNNDEDAAFDGKEHEIKKLESAVNVSPSSSAQSGKQDDMTKKKAKGKSHVESFTRNRDLSAEFEDYSNNSSNDVNATGSIVLTARQNSSNSTNPISAARPSNTIASPTHGKSSFKDASQLPDNPDMLEMEDITYSDHKNVGAKADFNNLETSIIVSLIPTTRTHKGHHVSQIIGDLAIGTNGVYRNKKDERGIVVRNKVRLVTQGHIQEEGIDYEEVFALVARIEAIRLFLAYASFMGFMVYQMDDKSAFLYGTIEEEVYVCQPLGFEDPDHPEKVYKVVKALYGLHQAPRAWYETLVKQKKDEIFISQDKYVAEILKKFGLTEGKSASTPIHAEKPLLKDPDSEDVNVQIYRSMIGSLMYLTSSRLDIMFAFWNTVTVKQSNDVTRLQALVDRKKVVLTETVIIDVLRLDDAEGVDCLPNEEIFAELARKGCLGVETPLFEGMLVAKEPKEQRDEEVQGNDNDVAQGADTYVLGDDEALDACVALTRRVKHLEHDKRIESSDDTIMDDVSNEGMMIDELDRDEGVALMGEKEEEKKAKDVKVIAGDAQVEGSMHEDEPEVQEVLEVVTTAKLITEVVTTASTPVSAASTIILVVEPKIPAATITAAPVKVTAASTRRRRGVVIKDLEEESTIKIPNEIKSKDKGKGIMIEEPKPMKKKQQDVAIDHVKQKAKEDPYVQRYQVMKKRLQTEAQAQRNMIMYMKNTIGFRLDYFKGMYYDDIRPLFKAKFNSNIEFLLKLKEQIDEEENRALESINETPAQKAAKRRRLNEEVKDDEEIKQHLEIMPDEDNDVYTKATSLARKVTVVDYQIVQLNNKLCYKIIKADGTHQLYVSFITLLKNFDREDLESLWSVVKERFSTSKPNNYSDDYLLTTLRAMFGRPDGQDQVWKSQRSVYGQAKLILLVERRYPLSRFTLDQMLNAVRLQVEEQSEMSLELISAAKHKLMLLDTAAERRLLLMSQVKIVNEKCY